MTKITSLSSLVQRTMALRSVLKDLKFALCSDFHDGIHVCSLSVKMHGNNRPGSRSKCLLDTRRIDVVAGE